MIQLRVSNTISLNPFDHQRWSSSRLQLRQAQNFEVNNRPLNETRRTVRDKIPNQWYYGLHSG